MNIFSIKHVAFWFKSHVKLHVVVALTVFLVTLIASLYYWTNIRRSVQDDMQATYQRQVRAVGTTTSYRLQIHEDLLRGGVGLFSTQETVTQADWDNFYSNYDVLKKFPEVQGIGFSQYLQASDKEAYLQNMANEGRQDFAIRPAGDRAEYMPVTYNAAYTGNNGNSSGYDGLTNKARAQAMRTAIRTGEPTMSGKVELVSENRPERSAFIIYMPVYKPGLPASTPDERNAAVYGVVYITIDLKTLLDGVPQYNKNLKLVMQVHDPSAQGNTLAYESANFTSVLSQKGGPSTTSNSELFNHTWQITFAAPPDIISTTERELPTQTLWRGALTSILFAGVVWYLVTNRERKYFRQKQVEVRNAKDDLLSLASHQLRTPATVVKQYVGMLLQGYVGKLTRQQKAMLQNAYESNERQLDIINQLLYVARLDAGRIRLRKAKTDLTKLIREVAKEQSEAAKARHQVITYNLPKRQVKAVIDPQYMRMVFENLLSNAIKYTPEEGSIALGIRKAGDEVIITVSDTGVGIDGPGRKTIFEKFTRVENELSTDVNGSGVGLYLTKQIVELHSGTIEVQSKLAEGSTFVVHLPADGDKVQA